MGSGQKWSRVDKIGVDELDIYTKGGVSKLFFPKELHCDVKFIVKFVASIS